jgi:hypothetical protein
MCCFITVLLLFGPRLAAIVWYLVNPPVCECGV